MTTTDRSSKPRLDQRLRNKVGSFLLEPDSADGGDTLAIALCSYFERHMARPKDDPDTENGWGQWAEAQTNRALDALTRALMSPNETTCSATWQPFENGPIVPCTLPAGHKGKHRSPEPFEQEDDLLRVTRPQMDWTTAVVREAMQSGMTKQQFLTMVSIGWDARAQIRPVETSARSSPNDAVRWICPVCTTVNSNADERCCAGSCEGRRPDPWPPVKATAPHPCPIPAADGMDIDGRQIGPGVWGIGSLRWDAEAGIWSCLANVSGSLLRVQVRVSPEGQS